MRSPDHELIVTRTTTNAAWINGQWRSPEGYLVVDNPGVLTRTNGFMRGSNTALAMDGLGINPYADYVLTLSPAILLPLGATAPLTDLSGNTRNGTAAGGLTAGGYTPGPLAAGDEGATDFDGVDDRITTTYATRRNLLTNPNFETNTTSWFANAAGATISRVTSEFQDGTASLQVVHDGVAVNKGAAISMVTVAPSVAYTASLYVKAPVGAALTLALSEFQADGTTLVGTDTQPYTGTGNWDRVSVTRTFGALGVKAYIHMYNTVAVARTWYVDSVLLEAASSAGTYFPTTAQLASGEAGWTGTANASASDIGCFSSGTSRTLMGWVYRDATTNADVIFSAVTSDSSARSYLRLASGGTGVEWSWSNSPVTLTGAAIPAGAWTHWALVRTLNTGTVTFYVNGVEAYTGSPASPAVDMTGMTWTGLQFGVRAATSDPFDGKQAWVSVHQTALTATQIRDAYDTGLAQITLDGPIDSFVVEGVPGQVTSQPAITFEDRSSQSRNIVEVGVQNEYDPNAPENLSLSLASGLTALGGSSNTRASSVSTNIIRAALATTEITVCKAASQTHKGLWKIRARVYPSAATVLVRLAWRTGDGPFAKEKWVAVPGSAAWFDLDLGTINIKELPSGHTCEFRVEAKSTSGSPTVDVDIMECIPADSYTKLRGSTSPETGSGAIVAMDDFSTQTAGAVTGKTPLLAPAGNYAAVGDADDFTVDTTNQWITRTAVSDSAVSNGRYLRAGSSSLILTQASVDMSYTGTTTFPARSGLMLRTDGTTANCLFAVVGVETGTPGLIGTEYLRLIKRVASVETVLGTFRISSTSPSAWYTLFAAVDASGNAYTYFGPRGLSPVAAVIVYADSSLATAGALATGGYGIYDANFSSGTISRNYDNFQVSTLATSASIVTPAMNANYGVTLKHNTSYTDNATGTNLAVTPIRQGNYPKLPPATRNGLKSRVVVRARRDDNDLGLADSGVSDTMTASLTVTPRVHLTGS